MDADTIKYLPARTVSAKQTVNWYSNQRSIMQPKERDAPAGNILC